MEGVTKLAPGPGNVALAERPEPVAGPGQVVLEVLATGICGTDLHIEDGEFPSRPPVTTATRPASENGLASMARSCRVAGCDDGRLR